MWPKHNLQRLWNNTAQLNKLEKINFAFYPSIENDFIKYFPADLSDDLNFGGIQPKLKFIDYKTELSEADVLLTTAHGSDMSPYLWKIRQQLKPSSVVVVWLWDNHLGHLNNLKTILMADYVFFSHDYIIDYLYNPASLVIGFLPACSAQWSLKELGDIRTDTDLIINMKRSNQLLVNYVDYKTTWRTEVISDLQKNMPEADVLLMTMHDRKRYFNLDKISRFKEWLNYKTTLILPVDKDLSTRIFDALLAGLVPIIPERVVDLEKVISFDEQKKLGIVRINDDFSVPTIRKALNLAIENFDNAGTDGIIFRQEYVMKNHLLRNRIYTAVMTTINLPEHTNIVPAIAAFNGTNAAVLAKKG
ncbi:MAG: hypothetical protein HQM10_21440 [Candidatus Riflebacteria bacterium]|nr:hypothetical protein [Candidatus Riflebacteria bacterium]